ncbi:hypothetical protein [Bacillus mycoides]|uniref:hypothetical protein n=1 Tax=Bacillus mycoides TaxID=1405 RepID=UPI000BF921AE|nr:hypothetical protein [Bacillus mycoides]PGA05553.1 hypothetical protein COL71_25390 [Bacillus mycoides]
MTNLEKKTELQKGKSFVTLTGKVKISDKTFGGEITSPTTGYKYTRINLGIETAEGNVVYGEMMGGYAPSNPVIFAMDKANQALQVNWADRLNESVVESIADFKLHKVGVEKGEDGRTIIKKFLSPIDVEAYIKEHLKDGMEVTVKGSFGFSEYKEDTQRKFQIQNIFLAYQKRDEETKELLPVDYRADFVQTVLIDEDSFKRITKDDAKEGEVVVQAKVIDYVSKRDNVVIKKNMPFSIPIVVKINKENPEMTEKILNLLFKVKKGQVRELGIEGHIIEGYEKQDVGNADIKLSAEIQELIAMGLYSEEEAKKKMTVRGNKVSKLVFDRPLLVKDEKNPNGTLDMNDDKYKPEDLIVALPEKEETDPLADVHDEGSSAGGAGGNDWMKALGI